MKKEYLKKIKRVRSKISGTSIRPRLAVFKSLNHISAQLIDDEKMITLAQASDKEIKTTEKKSFEVGKLIAKKGAELKIVSAVFDRRNYIYHGNIKELADGARDGGLKI